MKKQIVGIVLIVAMLLTLLPASVFAAEIVDSGTCGENVTWTLDSDGLLTISGTGPMADFNYSDISPFEGNSSIKMAVISEGVTSIGAAAFIGCTGLTSITIPDSVTTIGNYVFSGCTGLTAITVTPENAYYSSDAFGVLFNKDKTKLIQCPRGFKGAYAIPDNVTTIDEMAFAYCRNLTSVTIGNSVTGIGDSAFAYCTSLTSVTIPGSVTSIGGRAFEECTSLTSVTIPGSVTSIGFFVFSGCTNFTAITVAPENKYYSSDAFGILFNKDKTELIQCPFGFKGDYTIPDSVTTIWFYAFYDCDGLTSVTIPDSVTTIQGYAFAQCTGLTSVDIGNSVTTIGDYAFFDCIGLTSVTIPDSLTIFCSGAFYGCTGLTSVTIPDSVTEIGWFVFSDCTGLQSVFFCGDAPELGSYAFFIYDSEQDMYFLNPNLTLYYIEDKAGWTTPTWNDYPTATWTPISFSDVEEGTWCSEPVKWAVENNITNGTSPTTFSPDETCTRAQAVTFLWRANGSPKPTKTDNPFKDVKAGQYYYDAVLWAVETGITNGTSPTTFEPDAKCTRGQIVTFQWRSAGQPTPTKSDNPFKDVKASDYYYSPVLWAVENGITNGTSNTTFGPNDFCTRGHIVTFLYRQLAK